MSQFHHGTETKRVKGGSVPVHTVDGAIIGIVGTAPVGAVNELKLCMTKKDFAQFGNVLDRGYTLPDALDIISRYQAGQVYVVNVLDPAKHRTTVSSENLTLDKDRLTATLAYAGVIELSLSHSSGSLTSGQDYTADLLTGEIKFHRMLENVTATYTYADPTKVMEADIKGAIDTGTGKRTGFEMLRAGFNLFGSDAKILLCPHYDTQATMATALETLASQLNAIAYIQAPQGTTLAKALAGRGTEGQINFKTSSDRTHLFFPHVVGERNTLESLATHAAGLRMRTDVDFGYWFSTSNRQLKGVIGVEIPLTARVDDIQSETNRLNAVGITTVFNSYGTGFRLWGNRLANYPTETHIVNFEVVQRTADLIDESLRRVELQFIDLPIDDALLDALLGTIETYMGTLRSIVGFEVWLDPDADLVDAFSKGNVPIKYKFTPKIPAERITNTSEVTREFLINLTSRGGN
ncbi:phage tail sheath subtilisin-like domain-containing protein [Glaesserella parasuis]|uniref:phage tail sheath family protein n=1 Tax=Glaesserella parasuis TaxID=738 RepID=UPI0024366A49|nr:phage tail sheath subtilisin-like domain-containing protein [Glaesserella parasuis]MDG6473034.1 phage tail sheath subtilisin-like domain-containing protein [Glaesserella parasuis]MDG6842464.1 phage tail sheath subtilisin-like domain-containing protein [Glaesserella parasuis]MDO9799011.1 phage tail sheath subtilisin-like domain-containing protein [Glaesserella parasuis]MDO9851156.1 phage tail sheath subtilisin-like domain-containing protein [Glaesserella parasuis]MDO9864327.1 phage tail shea